MKQNAARSGEKHLVSLTDPARRSELTVCSANRRVSFAPEATLHTWDVIEYLRDATTSSSASSESTRRASSLTQATSAQSPRHDGVTSPPRCGEENAEPPSTPPEQVEELQPQHSPANQREMHQKKRRRSSGLAPMNPGDPSEEASSSPYDDSSPIHSDTIEAEDSSESDDTSLENGDRTAQSIGSGSSGDSTSSSARLDEALRQAAVHAGTQGIEFDENGDASMEMVEDEITNAFKPWAQKNKRDSLGLQKLAAMRDQENENPFSPGVKAEAVSRLSEQFQAAVDETQDMSMNITQAMGGIVKRDPATAAPAEQRNLKRRRSSTNFISATNAEGSPAKRQSLSRRSSLRNRRSIGDDANRDDETMDFTTVVGGIHQGSSKQAEDNRHSADTSFGEETMDFTIVVGGIKDEKAERSGRGIAESENIDANEDMSMELTATLDKTIKVNAPTQSPSKAISSAKPTTRTPTKSPAKSPAKFQPKSPEKSPRTPTRGISAATTPTKHLTPRMIQTAKIATPQKPPKRSPRKSLAPMASSSDLPSDAIAASTPKFPSSEVSHPSSERLINPSSPNKRAIRDGPPPSESQTANVAVLVSPVRGDRLQFSPLSKSPQKPASTAPTLSENIKIMSTPRKQTNASPARRFPATTLKKTVTPKKAITPKRAAPRKQVRLDSAVPSADEQDVAKEGEPVNQDEEQIERITLQDFLNLTNIRFMDLTTTKRRHTGHPGAKAAQIEEDDDAAVEQPNLENNVAVAIAVLPMLSMYQHSCHEMKNYISGGREEIRCLEEQAYETQPPLFREYLGAPAEERAIMKSQFLNMKTNARLQSKAGWHAWRAQLLNDLKTGLQHSAGELAMDDKTLKERQAVLEAVLPDLLARDEELSTLVELMQRRAEEMDSVDREELEETRSRLVTAEQEIEEKQQLLEELQKELEEKDANIETIKESKEECAAQIKEAERVREECRGWSAGEVETAKGTPNVYTFIKHMLTATDKLHTIEQAHGWALTAASSDPNTLTLCYHSDISLFFHPSVFSNQCTDGPNAPISLTYVGDDDTATNAAARPLTTTKRFFLQLLRAHLHSIIQSQTNISTLLKTISSGWNAALSVSEAVRRLDQVCLTEEVILSDERMAVDASIVLADLKTKVRARFVVEVGMGLDDLVTAVKVEAKVAYGERYDEGKMGEFLSQFTGSSLGGIEAVGQWAEGVEDLKGRLLKRGKKGERV